MGKVKIGLYCYFTEDILTKVLQKFLVVLYQTIPLNLGERGGSVVECRTPEREVRGSKPTAAVLCP